MLATLGLQPASEEADLNLLKALFGWMGTTRASWPQVFFDWFCGAASEARSAASPLASLYAAPDFAPVKSALMSHAPERPERLVHAYFSREVPARLLVEDVEAIWAGIAEADDWTPFYRHMEQIEAARMALAMAPVKQM